MGKMIPEETLGHVRDLALDHMFGVGRGHGIDHIERVEKMALAFAGDGADPSLVSLIALLHDADDYKFFPNTGRGLPNAMRIMDHAGVPAETASRVRDELQKFGYSKRLAGLSPEMPEAKAVSDADMCDIMGATGISRMAEYAGSFGHPFFDPSDVPDEEVTAANYGAKTHETPVRHMFEKVLRLPPLMLTEKGRAEANKRFGTNVLFLKALFREYGAGDWLIRLDKLLTGLRLDGIKKKPVHICIGVYPNMQFKVNHVSDEDLASNVEYNRAMRPGRYYFVDGIYICGGMDDSGAKIQEVTDFVADLAIEPRRAPEYPYQ